MSERVPLYFSHSYRRDDRDLNARYWQMFHEAGFSFTVDPGSTTLSPTLLELMMRRSAGFAAVVTYRKFEPVYQCSPFMVHEYGLAKLAHKPSLVLRDQRVSPNHFERDDTIEFDVQALERRDPELRARLLDFHLQTTATPRRPYRTGNVGLLLAPERDHAGAPGWRTAREVERRRRSLTALLREAGNRVSTLTPVSEYTQAHLFAAECDFVVVDFDDPATWWVADFLHGRGVPLLKVRHHRSEPELPARLLGSEPLRRVERPDNLVVEWADHDDFVHRLRQEIERIDRDRQEFTNWEAGHRYFRSAGRDALPVFVSNEGASNAFAHRLVDALDLENIPNFHYRWNPHLTPGAEWARELQDRLTTSRVFVPLINQAYFDSEWCREEFALAGRLAAQQRMVVLPVILEGRLEDMPPLPTQGADLREDSPDAGVRRVVEMLDELFQTEQARNVIAASTGPAPVTAGEVVVDFAIITILDEEYQAVFAHLRNRREVKGSESLSNQHAWVVGEIFSPLYEATFSVALAQSSAGTTSASICTTNTITAFRPNTVIVLGVAGGLRDLELGDVVVAELICDYEYGKIDNVFKPRSDRDYPADTAFIRATTTLVNHHANWFEDAIQRTGQGAPSDRPGPKVKVGNVASGDKVVDDQGNDFFRAVMESRRDLIAVEMEGAGAAAAIRDSREKQLPIGFGMIRGICDVPTHGGSLPGDRPGVSVQTETRDSWKRRASEAAAAYTVQLIRLAWIRPPRTANT